ncbi:hypothetical protein [Streptomyces sp. B6B3]|uniref:hypothetical protein n=1 Tax=Streptomyces sp. B6B3 TaxID=3153570 RepID=UPI00325D3D41
MNKPRPGPTRTGRFRTTLHELARWARARHRVATGLFLRGACYGAGTTAVTLLAVWAQTRT